MIDYCNFDNTIPLKFSDTTLCDRVCQRLVAGRWFSSSTPLFWIHVFFFKGTCTNILYRKFYYLLHTLFQSIWKNASFQYLIYFINNTCFTQIICTSANFLQFTGWLSDRNWGLTKYRTYLQYKRVNSFLTTVLTKSWNWPQKNL